MGHLARRLGAGLLLAAVLVVPARTADAATLAQAAPRDEAWYLENREPMSGLPGGDPTCATALDCNASGSAARPTPSALYPADTLHVGARGDRPDALTLLSFDLTGAPAGAVVTGGRVTLVAAQSGTVNAQAASMAACLVTEPFAPARAASFADLPAVDAAACAPVAPVAGAARPTWTVDLAPMAARWSSDRNGDGLADVPNYGIAILPAAPPDQAAARSGWSLRSAEPTAAPAWKVAFDSKRRKGGTPITSALDVAVLPGVAAVPAQPAPAPAPGAAPVAPAPGAPGAPVAPGAGGAPAAPGAPSAPGAAAAPRLSGSPVRPVPPGLLARGAPKPSTAGPLPNRAFSIVPSSGLPVGSTPVVGAPSSYAPRPMLPGTHVSAQRPASPALWLVPLLGLSVAGTLGWSLTTPPKLVAAGTGAATRLLRRLRSRRAG
jgi:hypothetical protein